MASKSTTFQPHYFKVKRAYSTALLIPDTPKGKQTTVLSVKQTLLFVLQNATSSTATQADPILAEQVWKDVKPSMIDLAEISNYGDEEAKALQFVPLTEDVAEVKAKVLAWKLKSEPHFKVERYPMDDAEE